MNVQELIDELLKVKDKSKVVKNTNGVVMNEIAELLDRVMIAN